MKVEILKFGIVNKNNRIYNKDDCKWSTSFLLGVIGAINTPEIYLSKTAFVVEDIRIEENSLVGEFKPLMNNIAQELMNTGDYVIRTASTTRIKQVDGIDVLYDTKLSYCTLIPKKDDAFNI